MQLPPVHDPVQEPVQEPVQPPPPNVSARMMRPWKIPPPLQLFDWLAEVDEPRKRSRK
ncbi:MAG: hypothetical protein JNK93_21065 [Planctomycetia bacterium]|nr:hypothetical protein [Planctomycetia bacterium]